MWNGEKQFQMKWLGIYTILSFIAGTRDPRKGTIAYMRHDIVPPPPFFFRGNSEFFVCNPGMVAHLLDSFIWNIETKLLLRFGEPGPETAPGGDSGTGREERFDLGAFKGD